MVYPCRGILNIHAPAWAIGGFLCLYRIYRGPSISDRAVGVDIMGILFVGITALSALLPLPLTGGAVR